MAKILVSPSILLLNVGRKGLAYEVCDLRRFNLDLFLIVASIPVATDMEKPLA